MQSWEKSKSKSSSVPEGSNIARRIVSFMQTLSSQSGHVTEKRDQFESMLDVGCGDGQSSTQFIPYFQNITGIDKSKTQIAKAESYISCSQDRTTVRFQVASGEGMPFKDSSQDLVCFSRSFHWMELMSGALREARRVLKPNGCLAMYCTGFPRIKVLQHPQDDPKTSLEATYLDKKANNLLDHFFRNVCEVHPRCTLAVDDKYRRIYDAIIVENKPRKGSKFLVVDDKNLDICKRYVTLAEFAQMLRSYAGYKCAMLTLEKKRQNDVTNIRLPTGSPLDNLLRKMKKNYNIRDLPDDDIFITVTWDVSLILSSRPAKMR